MILSFTLIFAALAILLLLLYLEGGHHSSVNRMEDLAGRTRPVDLDAFRNLVDPGEEDFLRAHLLAGSFVPSRGNACGPPWSMSRTLPTMRLFCCDWGKPPPGHRYSDRVGREAVGGQRMRLRAYALLSRSQLCLRLVLPGANFPMAS